MGTASSFAKSARQAIDRDDYSTALRLCEAGLEMEEANYMLLVLQALALQNLGQPQQAAESYRIACVSQPETPLAWQVSVGAASL